MVWQAYELREIRRLDAVEAHLGANFLDSGLPLLLREALFFGKERAGSFEQLMKTLIGQNFVAPVLRAMTNKMVPTNSIHLK